MRQGGAGAICVKFLIFGWKVLKFCQWSNSLQTNSDILFTLLVRQGCNLKGQKSCGSYHLYWVVFWGFEWANEIYKLKSPRDPRANIFFSKSHLPVQKDYTRICGKQALQQCNPDTQHWVKGDLSIFRSSWIQEGEMQVHTPAPDWRAANGLQACDSQGRSMKIVWVSPPPRNFQVTCTFTYSYQEKRSPRAPWQSLVVHFYMQSLLYELMTAQPTVHWQHRSTNHHRWPYVDRVMALTAPRKSTLWWHILRFQWTSVHLWKKPTFWAVSTKKTLTISQR